MSSYVVSVNIIKGSVRKNRGIKLSKCSMRRADSSLIARMREKRMKNSLRLETKDLLEVCLKKIERIAAVCRIHNYYCVIS